MTKQKLPKDTSLKASLERLREISQWFEAQESVDVEEGLVLVKEGVSLIRGTRSALRTLENEFVEIKAELDASEREDEIGYGSAQT